MRIAIPSLGKKGLDEASAVHFGRCDTYTILNEEGNLIEIIENNSSHTNGTLLPPDFLKENKIDILLCLSLGRKALEMCTNLGIDVYICSSSTVKDIFNEWKSNLSKKATLDDACKH